VTDSIHNHHNYAWRETYGDRNVWVVRKGATPAFPGQRGFVGGSMGDDAVILSGIESAKSADSLYSTIHGAGRAAFPISPIIFALCISAPVNSALKKTQGALREGRSGCILS
jgi:hypothetical protein